MVDQVIIKYFLLPKYTVFTILSLDFTLLEYLYQYLSVYTFLLQVMKNKRLLKLHANINCSSSEPYCINSRDRNLLLNLLVQQFVKFFNVNKTVCSSVDISRDIILQTMLSFVAMMIEFLAITGYCLNKYLGKIENIIGIPLVINFKLFD